MGAVRRGAGATARVAALILGLLWVAGALAPPAAAQYLVADLSERRININLRFSGAKVLLFGATDGEGDVAVIVRGPAQPVVVRRKERIGGIWVNRAWVRFNDAPAFYWAASSRPLGDLGPVALLSRQQIGIEHLNLVAEEGSARSDAPAFREALIRARQREGLYGTGPGQVTFLGHRLFRTMIKFPASVATGAYAVEVLLIRKGEVVSAQRWPLFISKTGLEADVYQYAHRHSVLYGIVAVLGALVAGWLAAAAFRRV